MVWCASSCSPRRTACWQTRFRFLSRRRAISWGYISLGTLMQMAQAFSQVTAALAFPVDNLSGIALWRASVERVMALQDALGGLQEKLGENRIEVRHEGNSLQLAGVRVMEHDAVPLMHETDGRDRPRRTCADRRQDADLPQAHSRRCRALAMGRRKSDAAGGREHLHRH